MFYEMLTGGPPFRAGSLAGLISKHLHEPPQPFPEPLRIPRALESVCLRALAKDRNQRPSDAIAFGRDLQNALTAPAVVYRSRRNPLKWLIAAFGLFVALIVVIAAGFAIKFGVDQFRSPPRTSPPQSVQSAGSSDVDLKGTWAGTYGPLGYATKLIIKNHNGDKLDGTLEQGTFRVAFSGTYDSGSRTITMKQTEALSGEGWSLGEDTGKLSADGKKISGTGKDAIGGSFGMEYQWSFTRK
jgi:serine/threonine protein kinase